MALHLGAKDQLGGKFRNRDFNLKVIFSDQCIKAELFGHRANGTRHFTIVTSNADDIEANFFFCDACSGHHMGTITKDENTFSS